MAPKTQKQGVPEVELNVSSLKVANKGRFVAELNTCHKDEIVPLPVRILLLVDVSGSMGIKTGRHRRLSKLSYLKKFARDMVQYLDYGDMAGLVTFGEVADVVMPLTEISNHARSVLMDQLGKLDRISYSAKTDLMSGITQALDMFSAVIKRKEDLLGYRNTIIIFSDGEINAGTQLTGKIVHATREKIRSFAMGLDDTQNQWVSISTIVTGSNVSETMYALSKFCSSDAFYHLDIDKHESGVDLFLPVMLRKTAIAWNVWLHFESLNGAVIINSDCTQDYKSRIRHQNKPESERTEKAFFFYDVPASSSKHIGVVVDLEKVNPRRETEVLAIELIFTSVSGERHRVDRIMTMADFYTRDREKIKKSLEENYMHEARVVSQGIFGKAAEEIVNGSFQNSQDNLREGQTDLQKLLQSYGSMAEEEDVSLDITPYAQAVADNLQSLLSSVTSLHSDDEDEIGRNWMNMKAVSSAITREAPTSSNVVTNNDVLCPLPDVRHVSSDKIRKEMERLYNSQGVRKTRFAQFDDVVNDFKASYKIRDQ